MLRPFAHWVHSRRQKNVAELRGGDMVRTNSTLVVGLAAVIAVGEGHYFVGL